MNTLPNLDYHLPSEPPLKVVAPVAGSTYYRLATNPVALTCAEKQEDPTEAILQVRRYLSFVLNKEYCPFVAGIEKANGYYVSIDETSPCTFNIDRSVQSLARAFRNHLKGGHPGAHESTRTFIKAFSHPDAVSPTFLRTMQTMRNRHRLPLMEKKMKLEVAHPLSPHVASKLSHRKDTLASEPLFTSPIPLIMMRAFVKADSVFMRTARDREIYDRVFGTDSEGGWRFF